MRYGIVSDVHSNYEALTAVLDELARSRIDALLCLGDIVGYGPNPNECCDLLRRRSCQAIAGNHDEAAVSDVGTEYFNPVAREAIAWTQVALTPENRSFLAQLPRERTYPGFSLVHGSPVHHFDYILDIVDAQRAFERVSEALTFVGHSHVAEVYFQDPQGRTFHKKLAHGGRVDIVPEFRYIINPGSVGQPRDRNPQASFACFDDGEHYAEVRRVTYDVGQVQQRIELAHLPSQLGARLAIGY